MALIQYSALVNSMSGKLNGSVLATNKGGAYIRNKGVVKNGKTPAQQNVRVNFGSASGNWRGLTDAQRLAWSAFASLTPYTNRFGETKVLSGFSMFMQRNLNTILVGGGLLLDAPTDVPILSFEFAGLSMPSANTIVYEITANDLTDWKAVIDATKVLSPGITNYNSQIRVLQANASKTGTLPDFVFTASGYASVFGTALVGDTVGTGLYFINSVTGQSTVEYLSKVVRTV